MEIIGIVGNWEKYKLGRKHSYDFSKKSILPEIGLTEQVKTII